MLQQHMLLKHTQDTHTNYKTPMTILNWLIHQLSRQRKPVQCHTKTPTPNPSNPDLPHVPNQPRELRDGKSATAACAST